MQAGPTRKPCEHRLNRIWIRIHCREEAQPFRPPACTTEERINEGRGKFCSATCYHAFARQAPFDGLARVRVDNLDLHVRVGPADRGSAPVEVVVKESKKEGSKIWEWLKAAF